MATCLTLVTRVVVRWLLSVDRCCNLLAAKRMAAQRNGQPSTGNRQLTNLRRIPHLRHKRLIFSIALNLEATILTLDSQVVLRPPYTAPSQRWPRTPYTTPASIVQR